MNNSDLLKELRIDRSTPPPAPSRTGLWIGLGIAGAMVALALGVWAVLGRSDAIVALILRYGTPAERLGAGPAFRLEPTDAAG